MKTVPKNEIKKIQLREVNRHLVCRLCRGYFVDATTIAECLHSFCRSCIIKSLNVKSYCPICEVQVHQTKPYLSLRLDKALQDLVYKSVPFLYHKEMARRRAFYENHNDQVRNTTSEQRGVEERLIFSPNDSISLSLEYMDCQEAESESLSSRSSESGEDFPLQLGLMKVRRGDAASRKESVDSNESGPGNYPKRYLLCPASVRVSVLKKFISQKFGLSNKVQVEVIHKRNALPDHYTLMDISYIFTWKRMAPMRLFYQLYHIEHVKVSTLPEVKSETTKPLTTIVECQEDIPTPMTVEKPFIVPDLVKDDTIIKKELSAPCATFEKVDTTKDVKNLADIDKKERHQTCLKIDTENKECNQASLKIDNVNKEIKQASLKFDHVKKERDQASLKIENVKKESNQASLKIDNLKNKSVNKNSSNIVSDVQTKKQVGHVSIGPQINGKLLSVPEKKPSDDKVTKNPTVTQKIETDKKPIVKLVNKIESTPKEPSTLVRPDPFASEMPVLDKAIIKPAFMSRLELKATPKKAQDITVVEPRGKPLVKPLPTFQQEPRSCVLPKLIYNKEIDTSKPLEMAKPGEKFLLNPISGKLEAVSESPEKEEDINKQDILPKSINDTFSSAKSSVQQLKTFRKDKSHSAKHSSKGNSSVTITTLPKKEKLSPKLEANVSIEIMAAEKNNASEYDFESSSPPNRIMSLQEYTQSEIYKSKFSNVNGKGSMNLKDFRNPVVSVNGRHGQTQKNGESTPKKKVVPLLHRINMEKKGSGVKTVDGKKKDSPPPRIINIQTPPEVKGKLSPPKPIKIENKGGEYSIKKPSSESMKPKRSEDKIPKACEGKTLENSELLRNLLKRKDSFNSPLTKQHKHEAKKPKLSPGTPLKPAIPTSTPVDLSKSDIPPPVAAKSPLEKLIEVTKNPLENLMDMAKKQGDKKDPNGMLEMLISVAQKQSIEPLLKVPTYTPSNGGSSPTITPNSINQALQFFQKLSSEMDMRSQTESQLPKTPINPMTFLTYNQYYQQNIEFVRMIKRQQAAVANMNSEVPAKIPKLSPGKESIKSPTIDDMRKVEKTLSKIQQQAEIQSRLAAASQNFRSMPNLLPYYSQPGSPFRPPMGSPGQSLFKSSQLSPERKSPTEQQQHPMFATPHFNAGLTSEMTFNQMFQNYLTEQTKMNKRSPGESKLSPPLPEGVPTPHPKSFPPQNATSSKPPVEIANTFPVPTVPAKT